MGSIRNVKYAARDNYAGAAALNESLDYIRNKKITVQGPFDELEIVQIAMQTCHELKRSDNARYIDNLLGSWMDVCDKGVFIGKYLHKNGILQEMISFEFKDIYNFILTAKI